MATRSVDTMRNGSIRSSIMVVAMVLGVRALRIANTSGVMASAEKPSPSAGRRKVMCRIRGPRSRHEAGEHRATGRQVVAYRAVAHRAGFHLRRSNARDAARRGIRAADSGAGA